METVWHLIVVVHLVGMAAVIGGWLTQVGSPWPRMPAVVLYGAVAQVISGPALVGLASSGAVDHDVDNAKIGVKLVIALAVFVVAYLGRRRDDEAEAAVPAVSTAGAGAAGTVSVAVWRAPVHQAGALALVNVLIAVLW
jgi:hypothetical protein